MFMFASLQASHFDQLRGTTLYYPPEWFLNHSYDGIMLDSWAVGLVLYRIVARKCAFINVEEICACQPDWQPFDDGPFAAYKRLCERQLIADPEKRLGVSDAQTELMNPVAFWRQR